MTVNATSLLFNERRDFYEDCSPHLLWNGCPQQSYRSHNWYYRYEYTYYQLHPRRLLYLDPDVYHLKKWLKSYDCFDVCMVSTGNYWIPIFNILEDEINVDLTHP